MKKIISVAVALCIAITSLFTSVYAMADSKVTSGDIKKKLNDTAIGISRSSGSRKVLYVLLACFVFPLVVTITFPRGRK